MRQIFRRSMDVLYWISVTIASLAFVLISFVIPYGVFTRYILHNSAGWPEPASTLMAAVITFFGAAACYRADVHMRVLVFQNMLPPRLKFISDKLSDLVVGALSLFMAYWGVMLCITTWHQYIDAFPWLRVGISYMPIPIGGAITVLFAIERLLFGPAPDVIRPAHATPARAAAQE